MTEMESAFKQEWQESVAVDNSLFDPEENASLIRRLQKPKGKVDAVLDTDTFNEIDDQYALAYMLLSDDKIDTRAIYAAPFTTAKVAGPAQGMEQSYREILNVLTLMGRGELEKIVFRGSNAYLKDEKTPVPSAAARDLAQRAMAYSEEKPLYVVAIGAITNVASALLLKPEIKSRMVVVWLGGNALDWPVNNEFNMTQDIAAARIVFGCGVPLVHLPCMGVVSAFSTSGPELAHHLKGKNKLCNYLVEVTEKEAIACEGGPAWSRPIWDVTAVGWLLDGDFMYDRVATAPIPEYDDRYAFTHLRHYYKYVYHIQRDNLMADLFKKLTR